MTITQFVGGTGTPTLVIIVIVPAVLLLVLVALLLKRSRAKKSSAGKRTRRFDYQPEAKPVPSVLPAMAQDLAWRGGTPARPKQISTLEGQADITGSLQALAENYALDQFTLATADGLVFASSGGENALEDAATYGERFSRDPYSDTPGVVLFGINHQGSDLVGIIRTKKFISETCQKMIVSDTKDILNKWI